MNDKYLVVVITGNHAYHELFSDRPKYSDLKYSFDVDLMSEKVRLGYQSVKAYTQTEKVELLIYCQRL